MSHILSNDEVSKFYSGLTVPSDQTIDATLLELVQDDIDDTVFIELGITSIPTVTKNLRAAKQCARDMWVKYLDEKDLYYNESKEDRARKARLRKQIHGIAYGRI